MLVSYSPQRPVDNSTLIYEFAGEAITVTLLTDDDVIATDVFDFSPYPDGVLMLFNDEGHPLITTSLPVLPIVSASRENGILSVKLLYYFGQNIPRGDLWALTGWREV